MKTWTLPVAAAQKFAANEYVAACYRVFCAGPNNNASCIDLFADDDGDGIFNSEFDNSVAEPPEGITIVGCGGYHRVVGDSYPKNNGFVLQGEEYIPVFYWFGETMDPSYAEETDSYHFAFLTEENPILTSDEPNHS